MLSSRFKPTRSTVRLGLLLLLAAATTTAHAQRQPVQQQMAIEDVLETIKALDVYTMDEVLWLARGIYSESDRPHEQRLVAWVIRNRVDSEFRGTTYRQVVLAPQQFSAFNDPTPRRDYLFKLDQYDLSESWVQAMAIAYNVYHAPVSDRPFSSSTRHFYSPVSMQGRTMPEWAEGAVPLSSWQLGVDRNRFQFFDQIDLEKDPFEGLTPPVAGQVKTVESVQAPTYPKPSASFGRLKLSGSVKRPARPEHLRAKDKNRSTKENQ